MSSPASKEIRNMKDFLEETELNLLECKVCFEKYSQQQKHRPKNLPCGHVICQECVLALCPQGSSRLECPFCRKACRTLETSICLPVLHLMEMVTRVLPDQLESPSAQNTSHVTKLRPASFNLSLSFGGWGILFNPTGIALCRKTGCLVVAHDGKKRIGVFSMTGKCIQQIGVKSDSPNAIVYPLDVAVTQDTCIAVTDAGDHSLKVFDWSGKLTLTVKQNFLLPWGLCINLQNEVIVSDSDAGTLVLVVADFKQGIVKKMLKLYSNLTQPREIAVCPTSGAVVVVEHLAKDRKNSSSTRVKIFSSAMKLIRQIDSFGLSLFLPLAVHTSGVAFDHEGNVLVADVNNRCVICLDKTDECRFLKHVVASGLSYPVALTTLEDGSVAVLDSGNHSVLVYSP
ncbi:hypothetical protein XENTR_v10016674 [Xenopus tropicalis]|uniref:RING-type E3 ubiquitin transferase n=1 Tax=Xenopus tropicalis TaxID=8364 RepID=F6VLT2_XENTR|nr:E3 ubiquitin-protein ligase NHLRC1 [Xenopus tropicalis]KAE8598008.1 hypothetical protein XENTR_v10016674 [Xenopus tropicalis]|eukprot:XP_002932735.1 PREDICTED: E3 ubiquitin-protein ligase NHLRC1 [Xenopus tropicalis]